MTFDGTKINITRLENTNTGAMASIHECSAASGPCYIDWTERDDKMMLVVKNNYTAAGTFYIAEGNGICGKNKESDVGYEGPDNTGAYVAANAVNNISFSVPAGETLVVAIESSRFKWVSGPLKGKVWMQCSGGESMELCAISEP